MVGKFATSVFFIALAVSRALAVGSTRDQEVSIGGTMPPLCRIEAIGNSDQQVTRMSGRTAEGQDVHQSDMTVGGRLLLRIDANVNWKLSCQLADTQIRSSVDQNSPEIELRVISAGVGSICSPWKTFHSISQSAASVVECAKGVKYDRIEVETRIVPKADDAPRGNRSIQVVFTLETVGAIS